MKSQCYKALYFIIIMLCCITFNSCSKWLDVRPVDDVFAEDAFRTKKGFESGLAGVYSSMTGQNLYGAHLKYAILDLMGGYWSVTGTQMPNYYLSVYDFTNISSVSVTDNLWHELYKVIHQVNIMYDYLSYIPDDEDKKIIKGELLGLRAYVHLELFKLFGPVVKEEGLDAISIPYYLTSARKPTPFLKSNEFFRLVEKDLLEAKTLLADDPIFKNGRSGNGNSTSLLNYSYLLNYRGARINYFGINALLARLYQLEGNHSKAMEYADGVISELESKQGIGIRLIRESEFTSAVVDRDIRLACENIFSLIRNESHVMSQRFFTGPSRLMTAYAGFLDNLYTRGSGSSIDYRLVQWGIGTYFNKFLNESDDSRTPRHRNEIQLINLPEMYFISAEANLETNPEKSIQLLNKIRSSRGIGALTFTTTAELKTNYIDEVRREYIGEGFIYTFYKRLFNPIYRASGVVTPSTKIFKFPIPVEERVYNQS
jgi:hypothetical protein